MPIKVDDITATAFATHRRPLSDALQATLRLVNATLINSAVASSAAAQFATTSLAHDPVSAINKMRESIADGNNEGRVLPVLPAVAKKLVEVWNNSNAKHTGFITACKVCEVPRGAVGGGGPDSDDDLDDSDEAAAASVSRCTANALSMEGGVGWMLAADLNLEEQLGKIGSGAFLNSDGELNKTLIYKTLHSLPADARIAQMFANGAGRSGGVCGYVRSIQSDISVAGNGAPNTRSRCLDTWDDSAEFAIDVRWDYITLACLPALRVRMSQEQLADTDFIVVATVTTRRCQVGSSGTHSGP